MKSIYYLPAALMAGYVSLISAGLIPTKQGYATPTQCSDAYVFEKVFCND